MNVSAAPKFAYCSRNLAHKSGSSLISCLFNYLEHSARLSCIWFTIAYDHYCTHLRVGETIRNFARVPISHRSRSLKVPSGHRPSPYRLKVHPSSLHHPDRSTIAVPRPLVHLAFAATHHRCSLPTNKYARPRLSSCIAHRADSCAPCSSGHHVPGHHDARHLPECDRLEEVDRG